MSTTEVSSRRNNAANQNLASENEKQLKDKIVLFADVISHDQQSMTSYAIAFSALYILLTVIACGLYMVVARVFPIPSILGLFVNIGIIYVATRLIHDLFYNKHQRKLALKEYRRLCRKSFFLSMGVVLSIALWMVIQLYHQGQIMTNGFDVEDSLLVGLGIVSVLVGLLTTWIYMQVGYGKSAKNLAAELDNDNKRSEVSIKNTLQNNPENHPVSN